MFGCYQKDGMGYGFTVSKKWTDTLSMSDTNWLPATDEEVKEILLKYAKEQYPAGTKFNSLGGYKELTVTELDINLGIKRTITTNGGYIFDITNGKWAEIVSKPILTPKGILEQYDEHPKRWKVGDKVTYKSIRECGGRYKFGGDNQEGFVGEIKKYLKYDFSKKCWEIKVQQKYIDYNYTMLESEFKEWDNPKDIPFIPENLVSESKKISPCKEGDYLYLIDATIGGTELSYKEHTGSVLQVTNIKPDGKNTWWVKYTPTSFGGGGCRINGNGWQWNKHIRLATSYEISMHKVEWSILDSSITSQITKEEKVEVQLINVPKI